MDEASTTEAAPTAVLSGSTLTVPAVRRGWAWFWFPIQLLAGVFLMQSPGGAVVVAGWLQRFLQRAVYRSWWRRGRGRLGTFNEFVMEEPLLFTFRRFPNWVLAPENGVGFVSTTDIESLRSRASNTFRDEVDREAGNVESGEGSEEADDAAQRASLVSGPVGVMRVQAGFLERWLGSLASHVWVGIQSLTNVAVLTLPGAVLWWVGWWGGWQNSFHKGYEQFIMGPLVSWVGILLFIAAMFYVPMASARQAATGQWKSFWEGRTVWGLVRVSWWQSAWVAGMYALANLVVMGLKSWPQFWPQAKLADLAQRRLDPTEAFRQGLEKVDWSQLTETEALRLLNLYYLGAALVVWLLLLGLKRLLAWLYAGAVVRAVQRGTLGEEFLSDTEWRLLNTLGLLQVREAPVRPFLVRWVAWAGTSVGRMVCRLLLFAAWAVFVAAIYISEFLAIHPVVGWLNQPLVQLPWFRYVPPQLEDPAPALMVAVLLVLIACVVVRIRRRAERRRLGG
jgi:hypothetical protein